MKTLAIAAMLLTATACQRQVQVGTSSSPSASAEVRSAAGATVGTLSLLTTSTGVRITGTLTGLTAGAHGIHLHSVGRCDGPEFTTAGAHLNPANAKHGLENPAGPHAGDLPNITVNASGSAQVDMTTPRVMISDLLDADGAAIVVHAAVDDQRTDPGGSSGARVACGIVR